MPICKDCNGTGADAEKTAAFKKREPSTPGHIMCWTCVGNGLEPPYPTNRKELLRK